MQHTQQAFYFYFHNLCKTVLIETLKKKSKINSRECLPNTISNPKVQHKLRVTQTDPTEYTQSVDPN